jgi:DNA invertase Pin-like site-specific DNA recombinase
MDIRKKVRCAIYTRKSTEDGLEQEFNSLDAQRDACAAYVLSQQHEGWTLQPERYDDGGFSGGNMERPALRELLAAVEQGQVDVIVVYKIDRLTRSLADFARIVDVLDRTGASFVSVTQAFNTTTSMGRLTLNVLLSFAQFERELTSERIRDKIAASKRKGLWMGGPIPLGYDVRDRRLIVNKDEAETVRELMRRYLECGSGRRLIEQLEKEGVCTKVQNRASGPHRGGIPFRRGSLYYLLANRTYLGEISHKGEWFPGEHEAIVPRALFNAVQQKLQRGREEKRLRPRAADPSLLVGKARDEFGRPMSPSHTSKGTRRYRYYASSIEPGDDRPAVRVAANDLERPVLVVIERLLSDEQQLQEHVDEAELAEATRAAAEVLELVRGSGVQQRAALDQYLDCVVVESDRLLVRLARRVIACNAKGIIELSLPAARSRRGHEVRLVVGNPANKPASRDKRLVELVADALEVRREVMKRPALPMSAIAKELGRCRGELADRLRVSFLAPDIVAAILDGRQPLHLTRPQLLRLDIPLSWNEQRALLLM